MKQAMDNKEKRKSDNIIHHTKEGKLYVKPNEFFRQPKVIQTLKDLLNSDIVKSIDENKNKADQNFKTA